MSGLETSPGATLAGGKEGWEAAMPTWVMMEEVEEEVEVDEDKELKHQVKLGAGGRPHAAVSLLPHTQRKITPTSHSGLGAVECHLGGCVCGLCVGGGGGGGGYVRVHWV